MDLTKEKVGTCSLDDGKGHEQSAVSIRGDAGGVHLLEEREFGHRRRAEATGHVNLLRAHGTKGEQIQETEEVRCIRYAGEELFAGINKVLGRVHTTLQHLK